MSSTTTIDTSIKVGDWFEDNDGKFVIWNVMYVLKKVKCFFPALGDDDDLKFRIDGLEDLQEEIKIGRVRRRHVEDIVFKD